MGPARRRQLRGLGADGRSARRWFAREESLCCGLSARDHAHRIFGFPMTGKTTLFRLLTGSDRRQQTTGHAVDELVKEKPDLGSASSAEMYHPNKIKPATIEYLDLAGMEKGESTINFPLDQLRAADALAGVVP